MGGSNHKQTFSEYHCIKCGNIPLIIFKDSTFDIICEDHSSLDLSINDLNDNISYSFECSKCRGSTSNKGVHVFYCFQCEKTFCNKCKISHDETLIDKNHFLVKAKRKNNYCKKHKKPYDKFCKKCKKNLCELCDSHTGHKVVTFANILPDVEHINKFFANSTNLKKSIMQNNINEKNSKILLKTIEAKEQIVNTYKIQNTNFNYIENINNIIKPKYEGHIELKSEFDKISIEKKVITKTSPVVITKKINSVWCMIKLNTINIKDNKKHQKLELIAVGCENEIILFNLLDELSIYQMISDHTNIVYSLAQYNNNEEFLFSSSKDKYLNVYKLDDKQNYVLIQKLKKAAEKSGGEIGKVITLSNKCLLTGDHKSLTIWKQREDKKEAEYEDFYNILINGESCNLLEISPSFFVSAKNTSKGAIQIYQNNEKEYPLIGEIDEIQIHNSTTNGLAKINDKLFCVAGKGGYFYVVSVEPVEIKLKTKIDAKKDIFFIYVTKNNYIYCNGGENDVVQFKILFQDKKDNNVEVIEIGRKYIYSKGLINNDFELSQFNSWDVRALAPFEDGSFLVESFEQKFIFFS